MSKMVNSSKPIRMWIDGTCFNLKRFRAPQQKKYLEANEDVESSIPLEKIHFDVADDGRRSISFELPTFYYIKLNQNEFLDLNVIKDKTNTTISIPKQSGNLIISGEDDLKLQQALSEIHSVIGLIRNRSMALQFIAIPLLSEEIKTNFVNFKSEVLKDTDTEGLDESLFQSALKLHLTIDVFVLLNEREKNEAIQCLQEFNQNVLKPLIEKAGPFKIVVEGIDCMQNNYKKVDVLYAKAKIVDEDEQINLQMIANRLSEYFYERGLLKQYNDNVKLHMTLINTKYRKQTNSPKKRWTKRISFDATKIMEKYKDYYFGTCDLKNIHISNISSIGENGFYKNLSTIEI